MVLLAAAICLGQTCPVSPGLVEWRTRDDDPHRVYLFVDGRQRGGYDWAADEWRDFDGQTWGRPRSFRQSIMAKPAGDFGVMREHLAAGERLSIQGQSVAESRLASPESLVPDDSTNLRLTVIGSPEQRRRVLGDLVENTDLAEACRGMFVQSYAPTDWAVADAGFVTTGSPTIYLQAANGRVLHRQDEYHGPERLAAALRRARPDYDPSKDPNRDRPLGVLSLPNWPRTVWYVLGIVACLFLLRRKR
jgi:hypothetical protein